MLHSRARAVPHALRSGRCLGAPSLLQLVLWLGVVSTQYCRLAVQRIGTLSMVDRIAWHQPAIWAAAPRYCYYTLLLAAARHES